MFRKGEDDVMMPEFSRRGSGWSAGVGAFIPWDTPREKGPLSNRFDRSSFCHLPGRFIMIIRVKSLSGINNNDFMILIITNH